MTTQDLSGTTPGSTTGGSTPDVKDTAKQESQHLKEQAGSEAQQVLGDAKEQARHVLDDARQQLRDQSLTQRDRIAETLEKLASDLERMGGQAEQGLARDITREAAQKARTASRKLAEHEPDQLLDEVRSFARERPGVFLLGAVAAGVVAGRFLRGAKAANQGSTSGTQGAGYRSDTQYGSTYGDPYATTPGPIPAQPTGQQSAADPAAPSRPQGDPLLTAEGEGTPAGTPTGGPASDLRPQQGTSGQQGGLR